MSVDVLEKPAADETAYRESKPIRPVSIDAGPGPVHATKPTNESKTISRRQKIGKHLRTVFEGHNEFLGWTPD